LVVGNGVAGGVVAYQVAYVFFLAPYAILAQPISTTVLPDLADEAEAGDLAAFARSVRWSLGATLRLVVPASVAMVVLARPAMEVVTFGAAQDGGAALIAAGVAALGAGLVPYACFMLLTRACYALGDSRTPALVAWAGAFVGIVFMLAAARFVDGEALVAVLGAGHSLAFTASTLVVWVHVARRVGSGLGPRDLIPVVVSSAVIGVVAWAAFRVVDPVGRPATVAMLGAVGAAGLLVFVLVFRRVAGTERLA
ncbi:MAG: lipid II flippase MurJ, partial [Actinomycetota bacterium]